MTHDANIQVRTGGRGPFAEGLVKSLELILNENEANSSISWSGLPNSPCLNVQSIDHEEVIEDFIWVSPVSMLSFPGIGGRFRSLRKQFRFLSTDIWETWHYHGRFRYHRIDSLFGQFKNISEFDHKPIFQERLEDAQIEIMNSPIRDSIRSDQSKT